MPEPRTRGGTGIPVTTAATAVPHLGPRVREHPALARGTRAARPAPSRASGAGSASGSEVVPARPPSAGPAGGELRESGPGRRGGVATSGRAVGSAPVSGAGVRASEVGFRATVAPTRPTLAASKFGRQARIGTHPSLEREHGPHDRPAVVRAGGVRPAPDEARNGRKACHAPLARAPRRTAAPARELGPAAVGSRGRTAPSSEVGRRQGPICNRGRRLRRRSRAMRRSERGPGSTEPTSAAERVVPLPGTAGRPAGAPATTRAGIGPSFPRPGCGPNEPRPRRCAPPPFCLRPEPSSVPRPAPRAARSAIGRKRRRSAGSATARSGRSPDRRAEPSPGRPTAASVRELGSAAAGTKAVGRGANGAPTRRVRASSHRGGGHRGGPRQRAPERVASPAAGVGAQKAGPADRISNGRTSLPYRAAARSRRTPGAERRGGYRIGPGRSRTSAPRRDGIAPMPRQGKAEGTADRGPSGRDRPGAGRRTRRFEARPGPDAAVARLALFGPSR